MSMTMRSNILARALGAALALSIWTDSALAQETFKIGAICSLTGPAAGFGKPYCDGFEAYVKAWNARGGAKGRKVELAMMDDETSAVAAVNALRRIGGDAAVQLIWLGISSNSVMAINAIASEIKIPIISGGAIDEIGVPANPYLFKVAPGSKDFAIRMLEWASHHGIKTVASLNANDALGQADAARMREVAPKYGIAVVAQETFANTDTNFNAQWVRIRAAKPDLVFNGASARPAILSFQQYRQLQLPFPIVLNQAAFNRSFYDAVGGVQAVEGVLSSTNQGTLGDSIRGAAGVEYRKLSAVIGRPAILFEVFGWDHGILGEWGFNNSDGSREGMRSALDRVKELPGINGPFNFTPDNHIGQDARGLVMTVIKGGKFVEATELPK